MPVSGDERQLPEVLVLPRIFESVALGRPTSPALKDARHNTWLTYHHLNHTANKLARCLLGHFRATTVSNPDGDRVVAVCMEPSVDMVIALLAIHKAGAAYLPLDVTFPEDLVDHILLDARPVLVLAQGRPQVLTRFFTDTHVAQVPVLHMEDLHTQLEGVQGDEVCAYEVGVSVVGGSIAVILYTSGSTGAPKGVRISHKSIMNRLAWQWHTFPYQKDEVCCFKTALTFVDSLSEIFGPILSGHRLVVVPKWMTVAVKELVEVLEMEGVGRLVLVPSLLRAILLHCANNKTTPLHGLRLWVCSGEVLPIDLLQSFFRVFKTGQTICNFYGSTEVMGDVMYLQLKSSEEATAKSVNSKVPVGSPISNCRIYLVDSAVAEVKEGQTGEIHVTGLNLASGYVGGAQHDKFITNPHSDHPNYCRLYRTGDFGRLVSGMMVFEGRMDSQIKVRGHRVDMTDVELALRKVNGVEKVCVLCYKPGEATQALIAFYTSDSKKLQPSAAKIKLADLLQPYMIPQLLLMDELPLLVNGKVDRQELLRLYEARAEGDLERVRVDLDGVDPNEHEAARDLMLTVARVLGPAMLRDKCLSLHASFFQLGGNSLNSILTVTSLYDLGYSIDIGQFMKAKSLGEVLMHMRRATQQTSIDSVWNNVTDGHKYNCSKLDHSNKVAVVNMMATCFVRKGDLEWMLNVEEWESQEMITPIMDALIEEDLSFVLTRSDTGEMVACSLSSDLQTEPPFECQTRNMRYITGVVDDLEMKVRDQLPEGPGTVVHNLMMGTLLELGPDENVALIQQMEHENIKVAARKSYKAIFATNTSTLTQQVCDDLLGYKVLGSLQVNTWVALDGTRPFAAAPDSQYIISTVKFL